MNQIFLFSAFLVLPIAPLVAQQQPAKTDPAKTKLESFVAQSGVVIVKGISHIGTLKGLYNTSIEVDSKEFTNPSTGKREAGITIEAKRGGTVERENTSYVDYDEIESLLKGLDYISKVDKSSTKLDLFEANYRTKDDLEFSTYNMENGKTGFAVLSGRVGSVTSFFNQDDIVKVRDLIVQAKTKLDNIK